ncbi:hypothetical protein B0T14DRAFT_530026 [Immersiella caudata]|uniref:Uncharacterized protein n=1 Tax=Immersiella caudata TaxID=314043 RepID=A0AA39U598_9PEZI|nr:hypothetical protein B0T14DRAFT_530026 [Immersiella caudata]
MDRSFDSDRVRIALAIGEIINSDKVCRLLGSSRPRLWRLKVPRRLTSYNIGAEGEQVNDISRLVPLRRSQGISRSALKAFSFTSRDWSVARKMSWVSRRQTTRTEDTAYSLMGISDINMPLLYEEGNKSLHETARGDHENHVRPHHILLARFQYNKVYPPGFPGQITCRI